MPPMSLASFLASATELVVVLLAGLFLLCIKGSLSLGALV
jgi:hypothetical protein